jgi:hypothetical protein
MRAATTLSALLIVMMTAASARAQPVGLPPAPSDVVALVYDDATIPDRDRAALVTFVASALPVEQWMRIQITAPSHIDSVIDDFYDYFPTGEFATPLTVEALRTALVRYNETLGQGASVQPGSLRLPPFPLHAYHRGRVQTKRRLFDVTTRAYRITALATDHVPDPANTIRGVFGRAKRSFNNSPLDRAHRDIADIVSTTILIPALPPAVLKLSRQLSTPRKVLIFNTTLDAASGGELLNAQFRTGFSAVELLGREDPCVDGPQWLASSPYLRYWTSRKLGVQLDDDALLKRAIEQPLFVLDVGFDGGHGSQVLTVTSHLLKELGFERIAKAGTDAITPWELVPSTLKGVGESQSLLDEYRKEYRAAEEALAKFAKETEAWLKATPGAAVTTKFDIPDLMLGSIMWRTFTRNSWVNVSSRVRAPFLTDVVDQVGLESSGALFAAVGNNVGDLQTGYVPQDHSMRFPQVVTVTCGTKAGEICGEHSGRRVGSNSRRVLLAGPGCGFAGTSGSGTSLATPYIAVASWLQHLIGGRIGTGNDPRFDAQLRRHDLLTANVPAPLMAKRVESYGFFDPAYLLLRPGPHVIMKDLTLRRMTNFSFTLACPNNVKRTLEPPNQFANVVAADQVTGSITMTMLVYKRDKVDFVWVRETKFDESEIPYDCPVESLTVEIEMADGRKTYDLASFIKEIEWITWTPYQWERRDERP